MNHWISSNPDLASQLAAGRTARAEAMARAGYLVIAGVERAVVYTARALADGYRKLALAAERNRRRRAAIAQLRSLDDRQLSDIGVTRGEIVALVEQSLERGPLSPAELRGVRRPEPVAKPREARVPDLPLAA